nr:class I SAM-dependent methyltransferase [Ruminococcus bromii]
MQNHKWTSRTKEEIDYLCEKYIKKNDSVIDVGCGIGRHTIELNKRGIKTKGIDFSKENIKSAQKAYNPECFISGDVRSYKFKEKYDVAIALYDVIGSFPNDKENLNLLKSIRKILNNKGILIISVMNMTYTKRKCWNVLEDIDDNIDALLKLQGTNTMQKTGDVFSGDSMLIDDKSGIVYRKEQFFSKNSLPCEYIIRDRRYTIKGIDNLLQKAGFRVIDSYCFSAKNMSQEVDEISGKEIFVVAQKQNSLSLLSRNTFLMPQTWKK